MKKAPKSRKDSAKSKLTHRRERIRLLILEDYIHKIFPILGDIHFKYDISKKKELMEAVLVLSAKLKTILPDYFHIFETGEMVPALTEFIQTGSISLESMESVHMTGIQLIENHKSETLPNGLYIQLSPHASVRNLRNFNSLIEKDLEQKLKEIYGYTTKPSFPKVQPRNKDAFIKSMHPWMFSQFSLAQIESKAKKISKTKLTEKEIETIYTKNMQPKIRKEHLISIILKHFYGTKISPNAIRLQINDGHKRFEETLDS